MAFHVYILASRTKVLYTGVTSNLSVRVTEHKNRVVAGFTKRYNVDCLVYFEEYSEAIVAIERETQPSDPPSPLASPERCSPPPHTRTTPHSPHQAPPDPSATRETTTLQQTARRRAPTPHQPRSRRQPAPRPE